MKIQQLIMTHKEACWAVERHLPIWENINKEILFVSPEDSAMSEGFTKGYQQILLGKAEHSGETSAQRIVKTITLALQKDWDYLLLMEYDSFALELPQDVFPMDFGVSAAVYPQNKPIKFRGKFYLHYPMLFSRTGLARIYDQLHRVLSRDRKFSDRFIGLAVQHAKIPVKNLLATNRAFSKNTILPRHCDDLDKAVNKGAVFFHGVKDIETLSRIYKTQKK